MVSGAFHVGMGDKFDTKKGETLRVGGFFGAEKDMQHYAWTTEPTVIQIHGRGPFTINYVNPAFTRSKTCMPAPSAGMTAGA